MDNVHYEIAHIMVFVPLLAFIISGFLSWEARVVIILIACFVIGLPSARTVLMQKVATEQMALTNDQETKDAIREIHLCVLKRNTYVVGLSFGVPKETINDCKKSLTDKYKSALSSASFEHFIQEYEKLDSAKHLYSD